MHFPKILLLAVALAATPVLGQNIPNGSFEEWDENGNPLGWRTNNTSSSVLVTRSEQHTDGQYSVHAEYTSAAPQLILSPKMAISGRPEALNGFIATNLTGSTNVYVRVELTKGRSPVALGFQYITGSSANFRPFSVPIGYPAGSPEPDSAVIMILMTTASEGSSYELDGLSFGARPASVGEAPAANELLITRLGDSYSVSAHLPSLGSARLEFIDIQGRTAARLFDGVASEISASFDVRTVPSGLYLLRLETSEGVITRKISIVR